MTAPKRTHVVVLTPGVEVAETRNAGWAWHCSQHDLVMTGLTEEEALGQAHAHSARDHQDAAPDERPPAAPTPHGLPCWSCLALSAARTGEERMLNELLRELTKDELQDLDRAAYELWKASCIAIRMGWGRPS